MGAVFSHDYLAVLLCLVRRFIAFRCSKERGVLRNISVISSISSCHAGFFRLDTFFSIRSFVFPPAALRALGSVIA